MPVARFACAIAGALILLASPATIARTNAAAAEQAPDRNQDFDGLDHHSLLIPSGDGTSLAITVHRPTRAGEPTTERLPVIVTQNRGEYSPRLEQEMRRFTDAGYVWVAQDRRGTGASFGLQTGFVNQLDARDALAVIDWSASQDFSSGKTVALGCSNQGAWQYLVATMRPASLVAIAPACASPMFYDDAVAIGGIPMIALGDRPYAGECREGNTGARPGNRPPPPAQAVDSDMDGALLHAAQAEQRCGAPMLGQYWRNMPRDGMNRFAGYQPAILDSALSQWEALRESGIAVLQIGGWFDAAAAGQLEGQRVFGGRVIMGPWVHGNRSPTDTSFPAGALDLTAETLRFFDRHAKGLADGEEGPAILYYTINASPDEEWREADTWPTLPRAVLYLDADGSMAAIAPGRAAQEVLPPGGARWFDGRYAALARWYTGEMTQTNAGSLLHDSEPVDQNTEITGTVNASLWLSADQPDANVFAMLQDVAPDGSAAYITDGRLRASWRAEHPLPWPGATRTWHRGFATDLHPLTPGEPTLLRFDFFPTSWILRPGHRLRLTITSAMGSDYDAPPLAGGKPVTLTLYRGAHHPSSLSLPMVTQEADPSRPR